MVARRITGEGAIRKFTDSGNSLATRKGCGAGRKGGRDEPAPGKIPEQVQFSCAIMAGGFHKVKKVKMN